MNVLVEPSESVVLESDGRTIWLVDESGRHESITNVNLLLTIAVEEIVEDLDK